MEPTTRPPDPASKRNSPTKRRITSWWLALALTACGSTRGVSSTDAGGDDTGPFVTAPHTAFPVITNNGGVLLVPMKLVIVVAPNETLTTQLFAFGDTLVESAWYRTTGQDYGLGAPNGTTAIHLTGAPMAAQMSFAALRTYVNATVMGHPEATPDGNTMYMVFLPTGTNIETPAGGNVCSDLGAHDNLETYTSFSGMHLDALGWAQRCPLSPGITELEELTRTASHEVMESATDPAPPYGYAMPPVHRDLVGSMPPWGTSSWSFLSGGDGAVEISDMCHLTIDRESGFVFQRIWSITAAAAGGDPCLPTVAEPYYSVSTPADWVTVPAGSTTAIPITGWSTGPLADWSVSVDRLWSSGAFAASFPASANRVTINNGRVVQLSITPPPDPGEFAVYLLQSSPSGPNASGYLPVPAMGDQAHQWVFGVHTTSPDAASPRPASCGNGSCETASSENCGNCPDDCGACGAVCGAANFGVPCNGQWCPTGSTCGSGGNCVCGQGYAASTCNGAACASGGCTGTDWWCTPAACGAANFTVPCGSGTCPTNTVCTADQRCQCIGGTLAVVCDGTSCPSNGCGYPSYFCTNCGAGNGLVQCGGGDTCPSFSTCNPDHSCDCITGYRAYNCSGAPCSAIGVTCDRGSWWCAPG